MNNNIILYNSIMQDNWPQFIIEFNTTSNLDYTVFK